MTDAVDFVAEMVEQNVLLFGEFTLKSGRKSPYFFNLGNISSGRGLANLGGSFANRILELDIDPDVVFGPAYKGIPIASTTASALADSGYDVGFCFNRKEVKQHGEGGSIVGASLEDKRTLIVDDVVTDGATKVEAIELIRAIGGQPCAVLVALDRMEFGESTELSAVESFAQKTDLPVHSVANLVDVTRYLERESKQRALDNICAYAEKYCPNFSL